MNVLKHEVETHTHTVLNALFIYIFIAYGCGKRGAEGAREVAGNHVFEQVGDDHRVWGASVNDLFMDPSGPSPLLGIHQTDARGKERSMGRREDAREGRSDAGQRRETMCWDSGGGEGGREELCIKRQTQKQDERGEMGCGREQTERVPTLVTMS